MFFFQSADGGRVFFDDLGWPWPKHPCTIANNKKVRRLRLSERLKPLRDSTGNDWDVYKLEKKEANAARFGFKFRMIDSRNVLFLSFTKALLDGDGPRIWDFDQAPSFLIRRDDKREGYYRVDFICGRLEKIVHFRMRVGRIFDSMNATRTP